MDPRHRGPDWMKISPVAGFLFHEKTQSGLPCLASAFSSASTQKAASIVIETRWASTRRLKTLTIAVR